MTIASTRVCIAVLLYGSSLLLKSADGAFVRILSPPRPPPSTQLHSVAGVTLKIAVDSQGGVVDLAGRPERFTSPSSLDIVHRLRNDADAVLVGKATVVADDPSLTVRRIAVSGEQPLRVVLDSNLELMLRDYTLLSDGLPTAIYHCKDNNKNDNPQVTCVSVPKQDGGGVDVKVVLEHLQDELNVSHLMVEGGPAVARAFLEQALVDRIIFITAERVTFQKPLLSYLNAQVFENGGLKCLGRYDSEGDVVECWSRPHLPWPSGDDAAMQEWP